MDLGGGRSPSGGKGGAEVRGKVLGKWEMKTAPLALEIVAASGWSVLVEVGRPSQKKSLHRESTE